MSGSITPKAPGILNDVIDATSTTSKPDPEPIMDNEVFQILKNPAKLRMMLEALLLDDLKRRDSNFEVKEILGTSVASQDDVDDTFIPKADRSTQETTEGELELSPEQMDFFGDGI